MNAASAPSAASAPPRRHRLVSAGAWLVAILVGGSLLWGPAVYEWWDLFHEARSPAGQEPARAKGQTALVRLAFLAPDGRSLVEESRELRLPRSTPAAARAILEALRAGSRQGRGAVLPPAVEVRRVFVDNRGVAYVDLSSEGLRPGGSAAPPSEPASAVAGGAKAGSEASPPGPAGSTGGAGNTSGEAAAWHPVVLAAQAVAATLGMSLPEIAQVQILVEGREVPLVADGVDLRRPLPASLPIRSLDKPQ